MTRDDLADLYRDYIACLNRQDWPALGQYVHEDVARNARPLALSGYRAMLEQDFREIPDLRFNIELLISDPSRTLPAPIDTFGPTVDFLSVTLSSM